ncbi:LLM class flavin-dependent oxidoreductase [Promicromonospora sp. NPDC057488]|uniref:LLM class flavin-dependent oxidoreductase n=1 Tax=Promicromonospora sp. NPDC057488 TaxID=3346147 RepID=UPI0036714935
MQIYSAAPPSVSTVGVNHLERLTEVALKCEEAGWDGVLVPHNLHEVDPWLVAGQLGSLTERLIPLVAVQPSSLPPHTAAAIAAAFASLYGRPLYFNLVAGAGEEELRSTGDHLEHNKRYERLLEYGRILRALLRGEQLNHRSEYYRYEGFRLSPRPAALSDCKFFVAGSSPAGLKVALEIADVVVTHPGPIDEWRSTFLEPLLAQGYSGELGIRIGILARSERDEAWNTALERFPPTRKGAIKTALKTRSSNMWAQQLASRALSEDGSQDDVYWLGAFKTGRISAPYFVGAHEDVGARLGEYVQNGVSHIILSDTMSAGEHVDINTALRHADALNAGPPRSGIEPGSATGTQF